jgi:hypothetical protein
MCWYIKNPNVFLIIIIVHLSTHNLSTIKHIVSILFNISYIYSNYTLLNKFVNRCVWYQLIIYLFVRWTNRIIYLHRTSLLLKHYRLNLKFTIVITVHERITLLTTGKSIIKTNVSSITNSLTNSQPQRI